MSKGFPKAEQVAPHSALALSLTILLSSLLITTSAQQAPAAIPASTAPITPSPGSKAAAAPPASTTSPSPATPPSTSPNQLVINSPTSFISFVSATGDGQVFFHGGQLNEATVQYSNELYSLDVTRSWNISSPAWTNLTIPSSGSGGPAVAGHSATMSKDLKTLLITAPSGVSTSPFLYQYDVKARTWSTDNAPAAQAEAWSTRKGAQLLTDPNTGAIWYIGGVSNNGATETNEIDKFLNGSWNANIPVVIANGGDSTSGAGSTTVMNKYSAGTSHLYGSRIYLFGGFASGNGPRSYQNFQNLPWIDISTSPLTIGAQLTLGPTPSPRQNHCSVLTESKKVIIFGGYDAISQTTLDDMWSLDLITLTWQQIFPLNLPQPRYGHTCNIIGANMIVYGGRASFNGKQETGFFKDTQVFDVVRVTWMSEYTPKDDTTPISKPLPGGVAPGTAAGAGGARSGALSTGGVIGIVVAVLALIGIGLGLFVYRKRQRRLEIREAEMEKEAYLASLGSDAGDPENDPHHRRNNHRTHRNNPYAASAASPHSASTRRLNGGNSSTANTPGMSHYGLSGVDSPTMGGHDDLQYSMPSEAPGNVQYLMQQLPDGTIAVQPVYLDHRPASLQHSPNMVYSETSSLGGFLGQSATSNPGGSTAGGSGGAGYIAPLSPANIYNNNATSVPGTTPGYVPPPSSSNQHLKSRTSTGTIPFSAPTHDPFASPVLNQSPAQWNSNASTPSSPTS